MVAQLRGVACLISQVTVWVGSKQRNGSVADLLSNTSPALILLECVGTPAINARHLSAKDQAKRIFLICLVEASELFCLHSN